MTSITHGNAAPFTVGVALTGAGWHPSAWREADAAADRLFDGNYWRDLIARLDGAGADYVTVEDSFALPSATGLTNGGEIPPQPSADTVDARLDALLLLSWIAPNVDRIGLIPTVTTTHTEPFHVGVGLQTLDHISLGRAGWQLKISTGAAEASAFGRKSAPEIDVEAILGGRDDAGLDELLAEAADAAEVARRLWDSWEDDAIIRDQPSGRFLDAERLHHIAFEGDRFSVIGPSIVPRSPQGQPPITLLAHTASVYRLAARSADVVFVTPENDARAAGASRGKSVAEIVAEVRAAERAAGRAASGLEPLRIVVDAVVAFDGETETDTESGADRLARLDAGGGTEFTSDATIVTGTAARIADQIEAWRAAGAEGVRIRPLAQPYDVRAIAERLLPELRSRGLAAPDAGDTSSLRERFGLAETENRYTAARAGRAVQASEQTEESERADGSVQADASEQAEAEVAA
ncbi:LLM class flavin-dependent oxidoreductase [Leucobacter sp. GX24907]